MEARHNSEGCPWQPTDAQALPSSSSLTACFWFRIPCPSSQQCCLLALYAASQTAATLISSREQGSRTARRPPAIPARCLTCPRAGKAAIRSSGRPGRSCPARGCWRRPPRCGRGCPVGRAEKLPGVMGVACGTLAMHAAAMCPLLHKLHGWPNPCQTSVSLPCALLPSRHACASIFGSSSWQSKKCPR